jgi:hypothetical protein
MPLVNQLRSIANPDLAHIIEIQDTLQGMLDREFPSPDKIAEFLNGLDHRARLAACRSLKPKHLKRLYEAVQGFHPITIDDVVPPDKGARNPVRHYGKNSLPAFTIFEKRFLRPDKGAKELWGYNHQALAPVTGPGYFVAYDAPDRGEVDIDYTRTPHERPEGWPEVLPNEQGLSNLVYAHMIDKLRGVTDQVTIGRAWKKGKVQPAWFILCRE